MNKNDSKLSKNQSLQKDKKAHKMIMEPEYSKFDTNNRVDRIE